MMVVVVLLLSLAAPRAVSAPLRTGVYVTERGWGTLELTSKHYGTVRFSIETVGANGHTCTLEGELRGNEAKLEDMTDPDDPCVVTMTARADGIEVEDSSSCRAYCGARASFAGFYFRVDDSCSPQAISATRKTFQRLYEAGRYDGARRKLAPVLKDCHRTLDWLTEGALRNDLAVTLHRLGDFAGCRAVLEPLRQDAESSDEDIQANYPPSDASAYLPIIRAARTNFKLCREP